MEDPSGREAVAWYAFKSLPNGGENIFLAGHLQLGGAPAVFNKVPKLGAGNRLVIWAGGVEFHYSVVSKELWTKEDSLFAINDPVDSEVVTLMTCGGDYIPGNRRLYAPLGSAGRSHQLATVTRRARRRRDGLPRRHRETRRSPKGTSRAASGSRARTPCG